MYIFQAFIFTSDSDVSEHQDNFYFYAESDSLSFPADSLLWKTESNIGRRSSGRSSALLCIKCKSVRALESIIY